MPSGQLSKQHSKLFKKSFLIIGSLFVILGLLLAVPVSTKSGYEPGTRNMCKQWPEKRYRYSMISGQKTQYDSALIETYNPLDEHSLQIECGQRAVHALHIL